MVADLLAHGHLHEPSALWSLNSLANGAIVLGYLLVPFTVLRELPLTVPVKVAGGLFFFTCAITHASMALGFVNSTAMVANHVLQAVAVFWFVIGFYLLLRKANRRRLGSNLGAPMVEEPYE